MIEFAGSYALPGFLQGASVADFVAVFGLTILCMKFSEGILKYKAISFSRKEGVVVNMAYFATHYIECNPVHPRLAHFRDVLL